MSTPVQAAVSQQIAQLQDQIRSLAAQVKQLQANQRSGYNLANSSIGNGTLKVTDANGNAMVAVGLQADGTFTTAAVGANQAPAAPDVPVVAAGMLSLAIGWDGLLQGALPLSDFSWTEVHMSTVANFTPSAATLQGVLHTAGLWPVNGLQGGQTYYCCLLARNQAGLASNPTPQVSGTPVGQVAAPAFSPTPPVNPGVGQLWYDEAQGYQLYQWDGTQWQLYQYGTNAIAAGSITAALIAANTITAAQIAAGTITAAQIAANTITANQLSAGIIYAGIVNGTTITGAQFIAYGTTGEILIYSGTPASNNLIVAISGGAGADQFSTPFAEGVEIKMGGLILDNQASAPSSVSGANVFYSAAGGRPRFISSSGDSSVIERSIINVAQFVQNSGNTTPGTVSASTTYQPNEGNQSSEYELEISLLGTWGTTTLNALILQLYVDGSPIGSAMHLGTAGATAGHGFLVRGIFGLDILTATTALYYAHASLSDYTASVNDTQANSMNGGQLFSGVSFDITLSHTLQVYGWWAATSGGGQALTTYRTRITRRM